MSIEPAVFVTFLLLSIGLILMPGPNVLLIVSSALSGGTRRGLQTVAGTTLAMVVQIALVILGVGTLIATMSTVFAWLRWAGVAYLLYLGTVSLLYSSGEQEHRTASLSGRHAFWRGVGVSLINPKTLLFFASFLPQFVDPAQPVFPQLVCLAVTFVGSAVLFDSCYALAAGKLRQLFETRTLEQRRDRITGILLLLTGAGLALARSK